MDCYSTANKSIVRTRVLAHKTFFEALLIRNVGQLLSYELWDAEAGTNASELDDGTEERFLETFFSAVHCSRLNRVASTTQR
jgi:hypothetical protein